MLEHVGRASRNDLMRLIASGTSGVSPQAENLLFAVAQVSTALRNHFCHDAHQQRVRARRTALRARLLARRTQRAWAGHALPPQHARRTVHLLSASHSRGARSSVPQRPSRAAAKSSACCPPPAPPLRVRAQYVKGRGGGVALVLPLLLASARLFVLNSIHASTPSHYAYEEVLAFALKTTPSSKHWSDFLGVSVRFSLAALTAPRVWGNGWLPGATPQQQRG